jgi:hypothetical protein
VTREVTLFQIFVAVTPRPERLFYHFCTLLDTLKHSNATDFEGIEVFVVKYYNFLSAVLRRSNADIADSEPPRTIGVCQNIPAFSCGGRALAMVCRHPKVLQLALIQI